MFGGNGDAAPANAARGVGSGWLLCTFYGMSHELTRLYDKIPFYCGEKKSHLTSGKAILPYLWWLHVVPLAARGMVMLSSVTNS